MKTTRPSFPCWLLAGCCLFPAGRAEAQLPPGFAATTPPVQPPMLSSMPRVASDAANGPHPAQSPQPAAQLSASQQAAAQQAEGLFLRVCQLIDGYDSIECRTNHEIDLFDHQIRGVGHYYQQGHGLRRLTHLELKDQIAGSQAVRNQIINRLEISDGNFFWTARATSGAATPTLSRVDLAALVQAWDQLRRSTPAAAMHEPAASGLPRLLEGIAENFRFERVVDGRLRDRPVWILEGRWKPDKLAAAVPDQKAAIESGRLLDLKRLPAQLPERIVLDIGQSDLFPCQLEYLRRTTNSAGQGRGGEGGAFGCRPIVVMQWFDVRLNQSIDPQQFAYHPGKLPYTDATEKCLKELGLAPPNQK